MRHMHLDDEQQPPALFYQLLRDDHSLPNVLQALYSFVTGPLHPCANCNHQWESTSAANKERLDVMRAYVTPAAVSLFPFPYVGYTSRVWRWHPHALDTQLSRALLTHSPQQVRAHATTPGGVRGGVGRGVAGARAVERREGRQPRGTGCAAHPPRRRCARHPPPIDGLWSRGCEQ